MTAPTPNSSFVYIKRNEAIIGAQTTSGDLKSDVRYAWAERSGKECKCVLFLFRREVEELQLIR